MMRDLRCTGDGNGREFARPAAEFGESVMYLPAASVGKNEFDVRREDGVWLGIKMEGGCRRKEDDGAMTVLMD